MVGPPRLPSLSSIRAFEAAARLGGFAEAARELGTTAASVSYHVRQLEAQIGVVLFVRRPHRVELTRPGALVARQATDAFAMLRASFVSAAEADEARLSVTALPTFGASWLTPKLGRFRALHPEIAVELDLSPTAHDLTAGGIDVAIRNGHGKWPGLRATRLFPSVFMPLCAPAVRDRGFDLSDPGGDLGAPLLGRADWWARWYEARGFDRGPAPDRFGTSFSAEHLDMAAAVAGHGIAMGSPILFAGELAAGRLVPAHDVVASDGRAFWFAVPVARARSRKIASFKAWLQAEASADLDALLERVPSIRAAL
jgi:LysR family transcriptional regulator, glycine cleavage system transcriptional activator